MATFLIRKDRKTNGYVVIRVGYPYDFHSHCDKMAGAQQILRLIDKGLEPNQPWMQEAVRRLLTEEEYSKLKKRKEKYINGGGRK
jgi:hypothetical protein